MKLIKRLIFLLIIVGAFWAGGTYYKALDLYHEATFLNPVEEKVEEIKSIEHYTAYSQLPETYINAVIAVEDRRFEYHNGIDLISTGRAIVTNLKGGELTQGGSTITQQLARNMYFEQDKEFSRKIAEMMVALEIEQKYDKEEIFELYANVIYFGSGYYNIYDASQGYFDKPPVMLNDYECTMLAGIPQAPSVYSLDENPDLAEERRQQVIDCMIEEEYISEGDIM
ncbi:MAG: transglycosylase domain-containing protein [Firmicutes bacterium]|nr:transglycosylase domain-containing protein [Bacillota bacterium]